MKASPSGTAEGGCFVYDLCPILPQPRFVSLRLVRRRLILRQHFPLTRVLRRALQRRGQYLAVGCPALLRGKVSIDIFTRVAYTISRSTGLHSGIMPPSGLLIKVKCKSGVFFYVHNVIQIFSPFWCLLRGRGGILLIKTSDTFRQLVDHSSTVPRPYNKNPGAIRHRGFVCFMRLS